MRTLSLAILLALAGASAIVGSAWSGTGPGPSGSGSGSTSHSHRNTFLFPDGTLRDPSTDRSEMTDDPFAVAEGRWHVESDLAAGAADRLDSLTGRSISVLGLAARHAIAPGVDVGIGVEVWNERREQIVGGTGYQTSHEIGAVSLGLKRTWFGVDSTGSALGTALVVRVPGHTEGISPRTPEVSLSLPWSWTDGDRWTVGAMGQAVYAENTLDAGRHMDGLASLVVSRELATRVSAWLEVGGVASGDPGRSPLAIADGGLRWEVTPGFGLSLGGSTGHGAGLSDAGLFAGASLHN